MHDIHQSFMINFTQDEKYESLKKCIAIIITKKISDEEDLNFAIKVLNILNANDVNLIGTSLS